MPDAPPADLAGLRWELIRLGGSVDNRRFVPRMRELLPAIIASLIELEHTRRQSENGRPTMPDETTTRDRIRAVIEECWNRYTEHAASPIAIKADLAERIDQTLFGGPYQDSKQLLLAVVVLKQGELEALKAEVRTLPLKVTSYANGEVEYVQSFLRDKWDGTWVDCLADELPHIAAILREPQESSSRD